jgi:hypothetical protein
LVPTFRRWTRCRAYFRHFPYPSQSLVAQYLAIAQLFEGLVLLLGSQLASSQPLHFCCLLHSIVLVLRSLFLSRTFFLLLLFREQRVNISGHFPPGLLLHLRNHPHRKSSW